ncbi:MAG: RNA-splicing ligase RtcB [Elusimicrobia bacterium]|nr:MAG: RNA-splicing ligase RtcB [Elusimicrobiota bacterium]
MPIKKVISGGKVPVKVWTDKVEASAAQQLSNVARLPFLFKHVAVMPDVHWGMGATIGSVMATKGAICPAAVGVDIGCGMAASKLKGITANDLGHSLSKLRSSIEHSVPVGFNQNKKVADEVLAWAHWDGFDKLPDILQDLKSKAIAQICSLGGGNHFIEVCLDEKNGVWVMLHSGSRHIGKRIADVYINKAKGLMKKLFIDLPDPHLAYLAAETQEFKDYMRDLLWAQSYALENRRIMMNRVIKDVGFYLDRKIEVETMVNCHHNFAKMEEHYGEEVLITRKGAVRARVGDMGIIPGSMGARSYIVEGKGNPESFMSCSHGAGRAMSRSKARQRFKVEDLKKQTAGVECRKDKDVIDEIPGAYKDIEKVMEDQNDLVEIKAVLKQVLCVKG